MLESASWRLAKSSNCPLFSWGGIWARNPPEFKSSSDAGRLYKNLRHWVFWYKYFRAQSGDPLLHLKSLSCSGRARTSFHFERFALWGAKASRGDTGLYPFRSRKDGSARFLPTGHVQSTIPPRSSKG
jgi:hypothetical protein